MALDQCANDDPLFILCVVSNDQKDRYSMIKKKLCVERAIPSQVIKAKTMQKNGLSVATKVAIQMLCKLGGAPWTIQMPLSKMMVIGYDVCHDTSDRSKSFGAMVATMDMKNHSKFFSTVTPHRDGEELSNELGLNVIKALHEFKRLEGYLPDRVLMYRDGVGEGQTQYVYDHEVKNIRAKLEDLYEQENKPVKFCFIIVSKRINTRIFMKGNQASNPAPGTVVDDVITLPERYDFFLISQAVNQGSASPSSYNVFDYGFGLPAGKLQVLTYKMCHLYVGLLMIVFSISVFVSILVFHHFFLLLDTTVQLDGYNARSSRVPICTQIGLPGWAVHPSGTLASLREIPLFSLSSSHQRTTLFCSKYSTNCSIIFFQRLKT